VIKREQSLAELNKEAWQILVKELGVVKAIRFWRQFDMGSGNYATDRDEWQKGLTVEQIVDRIQRGKRAKGKKLQKRPATRGKPRQKR
jgi:hypothetical protein